MDFRIGRTGQGSGLHHVGRQINPGPGGVRGHDRDWRLGLRDKYYDEAMDLAGELGGLLEQRGWMLSTAESCTGGLVGHLLTEVAGASGWYVGGVVAYADRIKSGILGVPEEDLEFYGAVSREVVLSMIQGAQSVFRSDCALAISGIAGPTGGSREKPVGTVWIAWAWGTDQEAQEFHLSGSRGEIKAQSALYAVNGLLDRLARD
jgi:nicotinamide-nucleotide amidase